MHKDPTTTHFPFRPLPPPPPKLPHHHDLLWFSAPLLTTEKKSSISTPCLLAVDTVYKTVDRHPAVHRWTLL